MTDDDDLLAAYDLSAWEVPAPAPGLVDAVIEQVRQPAPVAALDTGERLGARGKRRWWIAAATAASVAVAAILFGVWGVQRTPKNGQGEVTATSARSLAIGPTTAALDPGTLVRWRRDKHRITVAQPRGTALWNVAAEDTLEIDAGAMVATVEASGASLRVEVEMMNASDVRAIGVSAATAVAVALVTIVVYEGTVRVRHDGQTVNVVPGAHYEVRPANVPEPIAVGAGPADPRIRELEDRIKQLEAERDSSDKTACDEVSCVLTNYNGACCEKFKPPGKQQPAIADGINRNIISSVMRLASSEIQACPTDGFVGTVKVKVVVAPDGSVTRATATATTNLPAALSSCVEGVVLDALFPKTVSGGTFSYPYTYAVSAPVASCDADAFRQKGDDHLATGMDAAALAAFEKSIRCRPDPSLYRKAFLAACRSKNSGKAKQYFALIPGDQQASLAAICTRNGIDPGAACDAAALTQKGDDHLQTGMDAAALAAFESSMRCRPDAALHKKAFIAACRSNNPRKAQVYYGKLAARDRPAFKQICIRKGIQLDDDVPAPPTKPACQPADAYDPLDKAPICTGGVIKIASTPPAKVYLDGVDTGKTTPATLQAKAGKHKLTFVVGNDKYTYNVTVKAGETVSLIKDLR
jgi:hypothetical protein